MRDKRVESIQDVGYIRCREPLVQLPNYLADGVIDADGSDLPEGNVLACHRTYKGRNFSVP